MNALGCPSCERLNYPPLATTVKHEAILIPGPEGSIGIMEVAHYCPKCKTIYCEICLQDKTLDPKHWKPRCHHGFINPANADRSKEVPFCEYITDHLGCIEWRTDAREIAFSWLEAQTWYWCYGEPGYSCSKENKGELSFG